MKSSAIVKMTLEEKSGLGIKQVYITKGSLNDQQEDPETRSVYLF